MYKMIRKALMYAVFFTVYFSPIVYADDTEIYTNSSIVPGEPYVMFMLDYRANLNSTATCNGTCKTYLGLSGSSFTRFDILRAVMKKVLDPITNMKVGFMMPHANNNNCAGPGDTHCSNGAFVVSGFKDMGNATQKTDFYSKIDAVPNPTGSTSHSYQGKEMYFEFFRYLTGQDVYNGHLGYKDYGDNDQNSMDSTRDLSIEVDKSTDVTNTDPDTPGRYVSPLDPVTDQCAKIFAINYMFGVTQQEDDSDSAITAGKGSGGMGDIDFGHHAHVSGCSTSGNTLDNVVNWMYSINDLADGSWGAHCPNVLGDQKVTSFFITEGSHNTADGYANAGGTTTAYSWSDDPYTLVDTLNGMIAEILSVSTTFTAASVPVSVLNRSQIVDNVYIALFQADDGGKARWPGNIKKLKLDSSGSILVDTSGNNAIATDGRIKYDALTYWTDAANLPAPDTNANEVSGKDGRSVARGGAGQKIPGFIGGDPGATNATSGARQLYYEPASGALLSTKPLNADATTVTALQTALGAADSTDALDLLKFIRGYDVTDDDGDGVTAEARDWILGDSLHSRPLPINYGNSNSSNAPDIRLLMGTNDGFMHMFKNTTTNSATGSELGTEVWAFMPDDVMGIVKTLRDNHVTAHPYGVDGAPAAYLHDDNNDGVISGSDDKVWLYFGLRRGGKSYYALDISDPDAPKKLWTINKSTSGFGELGLTFSQPRVEKLDWGSGSKPVVIFGGGYDTNKDTRKGATAPDNIQAAVGTDDSEGNAIYIVDAETGALVWKATYGATAGYTSATKTYAYPGLTDSIPSTLTTLDTDSDKLVDRIYTGDTGGNVWRVDLHGDDPSAWTIVKLANLGRHYNSSEEDDRRFFHRPDFVKYKDSTGAYDAVIIGSGDRANPLDTLRHNWVYMIKDRFVTSGTPPTSVITPANLGDVTNDCLQTDSCGGSAPTLTNGWRLQLEESGEKALATATTINKHVFFTSYIPADQAAILAKSSCEPSEGTGRLYAVGLEDASAVNDYSVANGTTLDKTDRYVELKSGGIPAEVVYIPFNKVLKPDLTVEEVGSSARWKTYWYPVEQ